MCIMIKQTTTYPTNNVKFMVYCISKNTVSDQVLWFEVRRVDKYKGIQSDRCLQQVR